MNKIAKNAAILTIITLISGLLLGIVYEITKQPIAEAKDAAKKTAWQAVFPDASLDEFKPQDVDQKAAVKVAADLGVKATVDEVCVVGDKGFVVTVTDAEGYGGNITITVGIKKDGSISGISILSISETAGLGMRATEKEFQNQYIGKQAQRFYVSKDGGNGEPIDALSGATITSRAMTGAVNTALAYTQKVLL